MAKRKIEEVNIDVSDVVTTLDNAKVHGVVTELSPVKLSRKNQKYFSGKRTDGKKTIRVLSFEPSLHGAMEKSCKDGSFLLSHLSVVLSVLLLPGLSLFFCFLISHVMMVLAVYLTLLV